MTLSKFTSRLFVSATLISTAFITNFSQAAEEKDGVKAAPQQIHMESITAKIKGRRDDTYLTPFLFIDNQEMLWPICQRIAKIRDKMLMSLYAKPIKLTADKDINTDELGASLKDVANEALGRDLITRVAVAKGDIKAGSGPIKSPNIPNPESCENIQFQAKKIQ